MTGFYYNNIVSQVEEQKSAVKEITKSRKNTRKHAIYDLKNAEEGLIRAKATENEDDRERYCIDSVKNSVDSVEKNGKVLAEMTGIDRNKVGNREIRRLHENVVINNALKETGINYIDNDDASFLDSFASKTDGCYTTHSELGYGGTTPSLEDAERAYEIAEKANDVVNKKEDEEKFLADLLEQIDMMM